ncbi:MAG TPA: sodium:solute symporter [Streptosporangiaceae bacterium]|nr:sodium:solute symporter [Streptosporangiaceae bacterium]
MTSSHLLEFCIVILGFMLVIGVGVAASRWRRPETMLALEEWGLGGRAFGNGVIFFLLGGDLYTAYTFVAIPALVYGVGAQGFFVVAFAVIAYPLVFVALPRMWSVAHVHGFVTPAEFVRARFGSRSLSTLVAIAAIVATMPYIAIQLVGLQVVLQAMGVGGDLPLIVAFAVMALFTFNSGLRAPALIAIVKDLLLLVALLTILLWFTVTQGGWHEVFHMAALHFQNPKLGGGLLLSRGGQIGYVSLALGSALAIFLYPHAITGALAARNRATVQRSMATLPIYTVMLGVFALLGFAAISAEVRPPGGNINGVLPQLLQSGLNSWAVGLAFAALGIGALVPAAIMSIGAANLFTRSIYRPYIRPNATASQEAWVSKTTSLLVKLGAIAVILLVNPQFAIDLQLMGGVIILQVFPAVALGLFTNWFHRRALFAGIIAGLAAGLVMLYQIPTLGPGTTILGSHFGGDSWPLSHLGLPAGVSIYAGIVALAVNLAVAYAGTLMCQRRGIPRGEDITKPGDYVADEEDSKLRRMSELVDGPVRYQARHMR